MRHSDQGTLGTITAVGGLWGGRILSTLRDHPDQLPGTKSSDYGLPAKLDLREAARGAWTVLKAAWADFDAHRRLQADQYGDEWYGSDDFTVSRWIHHLLDQLAYHQLDTTPEAGLSVDGADPNDSADAYSITHLWRDCVPVHVLPAGVPLDKSTPHVSGAARQSPHSLVQDYLNRTSRHLWGIVTNGLTLRLLRDNAALTRQAYVEFDLATMFADDNYADFAVLWLALHASRFASDNGPESCIAEKWQTHAAETGVRALDALRKGVEDAIAEIGSGLIEHPDNKPLRQRLADGAIDGQALYRQLLYVAYRHVFLFAVEDRDLLHSPDADPACIAIYRRYYSTRWLRGQARRHLGGHHPDGFEIHKTVATMLASPDGEPLLSLPPVLGTLWDLASTPDINDAILTNRRYYAALRSLAFIQREGVTHRIDYRNMGSDELGAVYEALLEVTATASATSWTFELSRTAGHERKTTGSYYTPTSLIGRVLDDALEPVVARATEGKGGADAAESILELTVCDPAMGSAHFLTAAAHRLARYTASYRTGQVEPAPDAYREALRDVVSRCIYGVDVNPMAVELAKTALWLECHVPGKPLTFLDHHLKWGHSLLGVGLDASLIHWSPPEGINNEGEGGVPEAAFKSLHGDDQKATRKMRDDNRKRRDGVASLLASGGVHDDPTAELARKAVGITFMDDDTPEELADKQAAWIRYGQDEARQREKLRADAWTACWTMPKTYDRLQEVDQPFDVYYDCHYDRLPAESRPGVQAARGEAAKRRFFHWYVEYPEIAAAGGFDVMIGNPPWERVKIQQEEWFANHARDDIANAKNADSRNKMIKELYTSDDEADQVLAAKWDRALREAASISEFMRKSGRFPHGGVGDVNLYAVFADHFLASHNQAGAAGLICPAGLAVGDTYAPFFSYLVTNGRLASFWSFENEDKVFPGVHNEIKFALVTFDHGNLDRKIGFTGYVRKPDQIDDPERRYELTAAEIEAINPNTLTAPLFRLAGSARVTATIHKSQPVLVDERNGVDPENRNPWRIGYLRMFDMANDSGLFLGREDAEGRDGVLDGNVWVIPDGERLFPLYEGKMLWHYDHRYGTYEGQTQKQANKGVLPHTTSLQKVNPAFTVWPRYWVASNLIADALDAKGWEHDWLIGFRDVGPKERTFIPSVLPRYAGGDTLPLLLPEKAEHAALLVACLSSFVVDYAVRQKTSSRMKLFVVKQAPVLPPAAVSDKVPWGQAQTIGEFITPRIAELIYTAHDLAGFANHIGHGGQPFRWDHERRPVLQAELDALMFLVYGLDRQDAEWVLDSFDVLAKYERRIPNKGGLGEFRTKRLVLERFDAMTKNGDTAYESPIDPPPADEALRHPR